MSPRRREPDPWPWHGDTPLDRARRVAWTYRETLGAVDPGLRDELDKHFAKLGQGWIRPQQLIHNEDDLITVEQVADMCHARLRTVDEWRRRGLAGQITPDGLRFRVRDVLDYHAERRRRRTQRHG